MNKREIGTDKEMAAAVFLVQKGYCILEKNYYTARGELDLIAEEDSYLVFIEVKYRKNTKFGYPSEAVGPLKQKRMLAAAKYYMMKHQIPSDRDIRFDVVEILGEEIILIQNAF